MQFKSLEKYILILLFIPLSVSPLKSQGNLPYVDDRVIHFGFLLGTNLMDFGMQLSNMEIDGKVY